MYKNPSFLESVFYMLRLSVGLYLANVGAILFLQKVHLFGMHPEPFLTMLGTAFDWSNLCIRVILWVAITSVILPFRGFYHINGFLMNYEREDG